MCGFAGWFDVSPVTAPPPSAERRRRALDALAARGPDGEGERIAEDGTWGLLHRRLAVVDVEGGAQPMSGPRPGEHLAWNGELFDHRERRLDLEREGAHLRTRSDTEVLTHLLSRDGADALDGLCAQFGLAWIEEGDDARPPSLLLARDGAGEKPVFWTENGGRVVFASTLDALRALVDVGRTLDSEAVSLYLSWGFVPAPRTIWAGVRKLRAGGRLRARRGGELRVTDTVTGVAVSEPYDGGDSASRLRELLAEASRIRLESADVPVGVFLSGGLDSLALVAVLRDVSDLRTFTVRARDPRLDESDDAARVARALGVSHTVIDPPEADPDRWRHVLLRYGEPFGSGSALAVDAVARAAREHVKVALTGDGGDEALGGYPRHVMLRRLARLPRLPTGAVRGRGWLRRLRRAAELLALDGAGRYAAMYEVFGPWRGPLTPDDDGEPARCRVRSVWGRRGAGDLDAMLDVDRALELADSHCVKVDVACMGNGLEPRSPWLDRKLVEFCRSLGVRERIRGGATKLPLRRMLARELPSPLVREVLRRPKRGFTTGFEEPLRSGPARDLLLCGVLTRVPGVREEAVREILDEHARGVGNHVFRLIVLLGLAVFAEAHLGA